MIPPSANGNTPLSMVTRAWIAVSVPSLPGARFELDDGGGRGRGGEEILRARQHQAHRPAERQRHRADQRLDHAVLGAEAAADRHRHDPHLAFGQPQQPRGSRRAR